MLRYSLLCLVLFIGLKGRGQEIMTLDQAIAAAVAGNHDLKIARNTTALADLDAGLLNSGYLPTLNATAGVSYSDENQNVTFADGSATEIEGAVTESYNASITAEYVLFDGLVRKFTYDSNRGTLTLRQLQERQQVENTIIAVYEQYFNVAYQQQLVENLALNLENSLDRLDRAKRRLKYGQATYLDELNAQVDLNSDSITYVEATKNLSTLKRNLNLLLGREQQQLFHVDTTLTFDPMPDESLVLERTKTNNITMVLAEQQLLLSELDIKINKARFLPKVSGSGAYRWNESQNPPTSFALNNEASGINLGLNLSWNIFSGSSKTQTKKARINARNREIELKQAENEVLTEAMNAYGEYDLAQFRFKAEKKNLETNQLNFKRSQKQYLLGQITAVEFRQAQINLYNGLNSLARAKYDLKIAEITLQQLMGSLL